LTREIPVDAEVVLKSLYKKVSGSLKGQVKRLINEIRSLEGKGLYVIELLIFFAISHMPINALTKSSNYKTLPELASTMKTSWQKKLTWKLIG
jgi:hypothetical protein